MAIITTGKKRSPSPSLRSAPSSRSLTGPGQGVLASLRTFLPELAEEVRKSLEGARAEDLEDLRERVESLEGSVLPPSGDGSGASDRAALAAIVGTPDAVAVLESAGQYYDDGVPITFAPGARVITTDARPAFWSKGSLATTHMTAMPGCIATVATSITMRLPPAANWPSQIIACEQQAATSATIDPDGSETIGGQSTWTISGIGDRVTIQSRGVSPLIPLDAGSSSTYGFYGEALFGITDSLFFRPGILTGGSAGEYGNYELYLGRLRSPGFSSGSAIVGKDAVSGTTLFDWQIFGSGSATGYLYWREAFPYGYRIQLTNASGAGQGYIVTATGAAGAVDNIVVGADGSLALASVATRSSIIRHGSTNRLRIDANGFIVWSPNTFNSFEVQDAGISLSHAFGYVDITGGGSPGITLNTTDTTTAISAINSALLRRSISGRVYGREFVVRVATNGAGPFDAVVFTPTDNTGYGAELIVSASNDTDNGFAKFARREAAYERISGTLAEIGAVDTVGTDRKSASMSAAGVTLVRVGNTVVVRLTGVASKDIVWNIILRFYECVIT